MTRIAHTSFMQWYCEGRLGSYVRTMKSPGGILNLLEAERPAGDMSRPALPDIVLYEDVLGGCRVTGDLGAGRIDRMSTGGDLVLAPPDFATTAVMNHSQRVRSLAFPVAQWQSVIEEAADGRFSFGSSEVYGRIFKSTAIRSTVRNLWALCDEEGAPSRLLARAAGCEILAELCRIGGAPFAPAKGGLAPWAERRSVELMRARLSEDISLDELAAEAQLSPFHFARMFKQSVGVPPRVYMTQLRMEKASELLQLTELSVTEIAQEVGYSSSQVLSRVFIKHQNRSPSDYRRVSRS
ncbi:MAG: helix-turn-helix transcriptional regulator [Sphingomonadales bacterium]|nr:helix-turn-helix transcriptional regulator [Sphingomonadales bacterium]